MSYIDDNLMPGETVLYRTQLHWIIFTLPIIFWLLTILSILFAPLAILFTISSMVTFLTSEFGITNKRVIFKVGFIRRRSFEILLTKVESVGVDQSVLGRILNFGTITVIGVGSSHEPFACITSPLEFRRRVQEEISDLTSK